MLIGSFICTVSRVCPCGILLHSVVPQCTLGTAGSCFEWGHAAHFRMPSQQSDHRLPFLTDINPPASRRSAACRRLYIRAVNPDKWPSPARSAVHSAFNQSIVSRRPQRPLSENIDDTIRDPTTQVALGPSPHDFSYHTNRTTPSSQNLAPTQLAFPSRFGPRTPICEPVFLGAQASILSTNQHGQIIQNGK